MKVEIGRVRTHFKESYNDTKNSSKFKVVLIQEGLGNLRDCFYYTKDCLKNAGADETFEGKKCFADHPSAIEEQSRPERSTKDIIGHFENVQYQEAKDGRGSLSADLVILPGANYDWARALLTNALDYAKKYTEGDFVGLSINASGEASTASIEEFLKENVVPESARSKMDQAKVEGITEIRPVNTLKDAISCDLVTEAGAGGKILKMIEGEKKPMKKKTKEADDKEKKEKKMKASEDEADPSAGKGQDDGHDDAGQDKELFAKMIKQYLGDEHAEDQEAHEMAKHTYEAYQSEGMEGEEAYEAAGKHLKMALKIGLKAKKGDQEESEAHEDGDEKDEKKDKDQEESEAEAEESEAEEKKKESASLRSLLVKSKAENARLTESLKKFELTEYLDKKLSESKKPIQVTKKFREALGTPKSKAQIDESYKIFMAAYEAKAEEAADDSYFVFTEKTTLQESDGSGEKIGSFADCKN